MLGAASVFPLAVLFQVLDIDAVFIHRSLLPLFPEADRVAEAFWENRCRPSVYFDVANLFRGNRYGHYDFRVWADDRLTTGVPPALGAGRMPANWISK